MTLSISNFFREIILQTVLADKLISRKKSSRVNKCLFSHPICNKQKDENLSFERKNYHRINVFGIEYI